MLSKKPYTAIILLPFALSASQITLADTESVSLDELVIQTSRSNTKKEDSPQVITVITRQQIEDQLSISSDSSQVLSSLLPALCAKYQKLNDSSQSFRGRSVLYMIDGVPQSNPLCDW